MVATPCESERRKGASPMDGVDYTFLQGHLLSIDYSSWRLLHRTPQGQALLPAYDPNKGELPAEVLPAVPA
jgi:hypothetical protein